MDADKFPSIEHRITIISESQYGYIHFGSEKEKFREVFPDGNFTVVFEGRSVENRKVDWGRNRINLYPLRKFINYGDILSFTRIGNTVYIEKKVK